MFTEPIPNNLITHIDQDAHLIMCICPYRYHRHKYTQTPSIRCLYKLPSFPTIHHSFPHFTDTQENQDILNFQSSHFQLNVYWSIWLSLRLLLVELYLKIVFHFKKDGTLVDKVENDKETTLLSRHRRFCLDVLEPLRRSG